MLSATQNQTEMGTPTGPAPRFRPKSLSDFVREFFHTELRVSPQDTSRRRVMALIDLLWWLDVQRPTLLPVPRCQRSDRSLENQPSFTMDLACWFLDRYVPQGYKDELFSLQALLDDVFDLGLAAAVRRWQRGDAVARPRETVSAGVNYSSGRAECIAHEQRLNSELGLVPLPS